MKDIINKQNMLLDQFDIKIHKKKLFQCNKMLSSHWL